MNVHAFILHQTGDLESTLESLKDCDTVDIITDWEIHPEDFKLILKYDRFITRIYSEKLGYALTMEREINKLVDKTDSDYILIIYSGCDVENITEKLNKARKNKNIAMIKPIKGYNKLIVDTRVFRWLCGFGEQNIVDKVEIQAKNEGHQDYILNSIEELDTCEAASNSLTQS